MSGILFVLFSVGCIMMHSYSVFTLYSILIIYVIYYRYDIIYISYHVL